MQNRNIQVFEINLTAAGVRRKHFTKKDISMENWVRDVKITKTERELDQRSSLKDHSKYIRNLANASGI